MIDFSKIEQYRENNRIEAKKALGGLPRSVWETYSAFANTYGGIILLGVEELADKSFRTVDLPDPEKLIKEFWDIVNNPNKTSVNMLQGRVCSGGGRRPHRSHQRPPCGALLQAGLCGWVSPEHIPTQRRG